MGRLATTAKRLDWRQCVPVLALVIGSLAYYYMSRPQHINPDQLRNYLKIRGNLVVDSGVSGDFQQVNYVYDGVGVAVTDDAANHTHPISSGQYIAWLQTPYGGTSTLLYLYDSLSGRTRQITFYGTSSNPSIDGNHLVWEDGNGQKPQIKYFDGSTVQQISKGDYPSVRPQISGNRIAYAQYVGEGSWQVMEYDVDTKQTRQVATGSEPNAWPKYIDGKLYTDKP